MTSTHQIAAEYELAFGATTVTQILDEIGAKYDRQTGEIFSHSDVDTVYAILDDMR